MLVLCSNGLSSEMLLAQLGEKTAGCKTAALVVTADNAYKESNYHVARCVSELQALNLCVDIFDLDRQRAALLLNYDVVEFIGGNPYYLLHSIREHNAVGVLREIAKDKILIGWSAAAFVFWSYAGIGESLFSRNELFGVDGFTWTLLNGSTGAAAL